MSELANLPTEGANPRSERSMNVDLEMLGSSMRIGAVRQSAGAASDRGGMVDANYGADRGGGRLFYLGAGRRDGGCWMRRSARRAKRRRNWCRGSSRRGPAPAAVDRAGRRIIRHPERGPRRARFRRVVTCSVGIAASGRTPYVRGLETRETGAADDWADVRPGRRLRPRQSGGCA